MVNLKKVIEQLEFQLEEGKEKVAARRLEMADQDNANVSRYITATRWAVEQEIECLDKETVRLQRGINELERLKGEKKRYFGQYFVADDFEQLSLEIISGRSELGKDILNHNIGKIKDVGRNTDKDYTKGSKQ